MPKLYCCICKGSMTELHYPGKTIVFPTNTHDSAYIEIPQPLCAKCNASFKTWLKERDKYFLKFKRRTVYGRRGRCTN